MNIFRFTAHKNEPLTKFRLNWKRFTARLDIPSFTSIRYGTHFWSNKRMYRISKRLRVLK